MAIDSHDKIKPGLQGQLGIFVAEDLESEGVVIRSILGLPDGLTIQPANKAIKRAEHHVDRTVPGHDRIGAREWGGSR